MKYKNIVFDIGNVLLSYRWKDIMIEYGLTQEEAEDFYKKTCKDPIWVEFDYENISYNEVISRFIKKYPDKKDELDYFFSNKDKMPIARPRVYEKCKKLKNKGYNLYILSNYSSVLYEAHTKKIPVMEIFTGIMVSYMIHIIKPDAGIYNALYKEYNINPKESLFFDDREENIKGAKATGMDGVTVYSEEQLLSELDKLL